MFRVCKVPSTVGSNPTSESEQTLSFHIAHSVEDCGQSRSQESRRSPLVDAKGKARLPGYHPRIPATPLSCRIRVSPALVEDGAEGAHAQTEDAGVVEAAPLWAWGEGWVRVRVSTGFGRGLGGGGGSGLGH